MPHGRRARLGGLYALTPQTAPPGMTVTDCVDAYLAGGARLIQYRDKRGDAATRERLARALLGRCRAAGVPLIVNDDVELAARIGADGVHLGRDDPQLAYARRRLGPGTLIGVSCYADLWRARLAAAQGADYVAFGSFFPSRTKPEAVRATPDLLRRSRSLGLPLVAIGGITPENTPGLVAAGADMVAVISGLLTDEPLAEAARAYARLFA